MENLNDLSGNNTLDTPPEKQDVSHLFSKSISDKKVVNHRRTVLSKKNSNKLMVNELLSKYFRLTSVISNSPRDDGFKFFAISITWLS